MENKVSLLAQTSEIIVRIILLCIEYIQDNIYWEYFRD